MVDAEVMGIQAVVGWLTKVGRVLSCRNGVILAGETGVRPPVIVAEKGPS